MIKTIALSVLFIATPALASQTPFVLDCYKKATQLDGTYNGFAALCSHVDNAADVKAVLACYAQAIQLEGEYDGFGVLCSHAEAE